MVTYKGRLLYTILFYSKKMSVTILFNWTYWNTAKLRSLHEYTITMNTWQQHYVNYAHLNQISHQYLDVIKLCMFSTKQNPSNNALNQKIYSTQGLKTMPSLKSIHKCEISFQPNRHIFQHVGRRKMYQEWYG